MKKSVLLLIVVLSTPICAIAQKQASVETATTAIAEFWRIKSESGMDGARQWIDTCYLDAIKQNDIQKVHYCAAAHLEGHLYDQAYSKALRLPELSGYTYDDFAKHLASAMEKMGYQGDTAGFLKELFLSVRASKSSNAKNAK